MPLILSPSSSRPRLRRLTGVASMGSRSSRSGPYAPPGPSRSGTSGAAAGARNGLSRGGAGTRARRPRGNGSALLQRRQNAASSASASLPRENFLYLLRLRPVTINKYKVGMRRVEAFAKKNRRSLRFSADAVTCALDRTLEAFAENCFRAGEGVADARNAVWGYVFCKRLPRKSPGFLYRTKQALAGWTARCPGQEGRPSPWIATVAIAKWFQTNRGVKGSHAARALVVQQRGHMRPSEALALKGADVHVVVRSRRGPSVSGVAVTICPRPEHLPTGEVRRTKAGSFEDTIAFDEICDLRAGHGWVGDLLRNLKAETAPTARLFPIDLPELEQLHRQAVDALGLQALRLTPHSGRHGGPSEDAAAGLRTASEIMKRGRWESPKSVRRYMKPGTLLRQLNLLPSTLVEARSQTLTLLPGDLAPRPWKRSLPTAPNAAIAKRRRG